MSELLAGERFIVSQLSSVDVVGGIHYGVAKDKVPYPRIVFQYLSGNDVTVRGATIIAVNALYLVRAMTRGSQSAADALATSIQTALQGQHNVDFDEGMVMVCKRDQPFDMIEVEPETQEVIYHRGGIYHLILK